MSTLQLENIKHPDASGNALELGADGSITNNVAISGNVGIGSSTVPSKPLVITSSVNNLLGTQLVVESTTESAGIQLNPVGSAHVYEMQANSSNDWFVYNRTNEQYALKINGNSHITMPYQPCISGRIGAAMSHPTSGQKIAFGTFWTQQGITYNSSTRRFTVPVAGRYRVMFNAFTNPGYSTYRMILGLNTDTPTNNTAVAQIYSNSNQHQTLPIHAVLDLQANDYLVFWLWEGQLYNSTTGDWFNDFSIDLIG